MPGTCVPVHRIPYPNEQSRLPRFRDVSQPYTSSQYGRTTVEAPLPDTGSKTHTERVCKRGSISIRRIYALYAYEIYARMPYSPSLIPLRNNGVCQEFEIAEGSSSKRLISS